MCTTIVIVDTNCFVRLYFSPLRPLLGIDVAGHRLMTIRELANETTGCGGLTVRHAWLAASDVQADLRNAILALSAADDQRYDEDALIYRMQGDAYLAWYCARRGMSERRQLSQADSKALAVALDRQYVLATDEWPLREYAAIIDADEGGNGLALMSTLGVLKLFMDAKRMTIADVRSVVRDWVRADERLPRDWRSEYRTLFGHPVPDAQG